MLCFGALARVRTFARATNHSGGAGDGVFETISVGSGLLQALEHHLRRFADSARYVELPTPHLDAWRAAILSAISAADPNEESSVKTVITLDRGYRHDVESTSPRRLAGKPMA